MSEQGQIQDFGQGGASRVLTPRGALSPKFAQIGVFPQKLSENYMILKKSWGGAPLDPLVLFLNEVPNARQGV